MFWECAVHLQGFEKGGGEGWANRVYYGGFENGALPFHLTSGPP